MSESTSTVSSFVLRCSPVQSPHADEPIWRVRVTHVQSQKEWTVMSLAEAMTAIEKVLERGKQDDAGG